MYKERTLTKTLSDLSSAFPVILLTGPRQVGKTTMLSQTAREGRRYVTLDDFEQRRLAQEDPALFLQAHPPPVTIDEVQYAPQLFPYIKIAVDQKKEPGMYWLTGSQKFHLMKGITETLAGRIAIVDMLGLSQAEILDRPEENTPFLPTEEWLLEARNCQKPRRDLMEVYRSIWKGSYPKLVTDPKVPRDTFYRSYLLTFVSRDIQDYARIGDQMSFHRFLRAVAARTAQLLNYNELARDVDIDPKTAKAWLSILEASGVIYILQPYFVNLTKRLIKAPKLYFLDTGLCSYLTQWSSPESLEAGAMSGALFETFAFTEILKSYWHNGRSAYFNFYRDRDQRKVDLLIEQDQTLYPVEFKKTANPSRHATRHFSALTNLDKQPGQGAVICLVPEALPLSREVSAIPVGWI